MQVDLGVKLVKRDGSDDACNNFDVTIQRTKSEN